MVFFGKGNHLIAMGHTRCIYTGLINATYDAIRDGPLQGVLNVSMAMCLSLQQMCANASCVRCLWSMSLKPA
jgi:hypothetical protein